VLPDLPPGPPKRLQRAGEWVGDLPPRSALERDLMVEAAELEDALQRGKWVEEQLLAAWRHDQVRAIGRRLLYIAEPEEVRVSRMPNRTDDPGRLVSQLEASAEGCRWLIERWAEFQNLLEYKVKWKETELMRFIRLQGKNIVETVFNPELNTIFLAWEVLIPEHAKQEWSYLQGSRPTFDPAMNNRPNWREIAQRPADPDAAWAALLEIVYQHIDRLQELLARNEAIEAE